jgi:AbrB family looped-hinge helix DNA binding protein
MEITRLSSKGQVVIPKSVREARGWKEGTELEIEDRGAEIVIREVRRLKVTSIEEVAGCLANAYTGPPISIEQMNEGIAAEAERRWRRFTEQSDDRD